MDSTIIIVIAFAYSFASGVFCAMIAEDKYRGQFVWFMNGFLFNLVAIIAIGFLPSKAIKL